MSLFALTNHLDMLASSKTGLRRSRAMAQLWGEIRRSSPDDRRSFAQVLAKRIAPALSEHFEAISGLEGPEFVRLVRSLIELDNDDLARITADLRSVDADADTAVRVIAAPVAQQLATEITSDAGREDLLDDVFELLVDHTDRVIAEDEPLFDVEVLSDELIEVSGQPDATAEPIPVRKSNYQLAQERIEGYGDEYHHVEVDEIESPDGPFEAPPRRVPPTVNQNPQPAGHLDEPVPRADLRDEVLAAPDGWRRRRAIGGLIRDQRINTRQALILSDHLERQSDRWWIVGDLIASDIGLSDRAILADRPLPARLRRRLEELDA